LKKYQSVFGDPPPRSRIDPASVPKAITAKLGEFGIELSPAGERWNVARLDGYLARQNVSLENRLMVKSLLRQADAIE
jgi:hypothetical protein